MLKETLTKLVTAMDGDDLLGSAISTKLMEEEDSEAVSLKRSSNVTILGFAPEMIILIV